jgi:hypothetical protein
MVYKNCPHIEYVRSINICIFKVEATDADLGANAEITYSIYHVSNNGRQKFKIDSRTGLIETTGKLNAGEQYSITVQVNVLHEKGQVR